MQGVGRKSEHLLHLVRAHMGLLAKEIVDFVAVDRQAWLCAQPVLQRRPANCQQLGSNKGHCGQSLTVKALQTPEALPGRLVGPVYRVRHVGEALKLAETSCQIVTGGEGFGQHRGAFGEMPLKPADVGHYLRDGCELSLPGFYVDKNTLGIPGKAGISLCTGGYALTRHEMSLFLCWDGWHCTQQTTDAQATVPGNTDT